MACGGCAKRSAARQAAAAANDAPTLLKGGYKYLNHRQLSARLEGYKKKNCTDCDKRYECDWGMFSSCKKHA